MAKKWYVLRVQTAREDQVRESLEKRFDLIRTFHLVGILS